MPLSTQRRAAIERRVLRYLGNDTCKIEVQADASGDYGAPANAWDTIATGVSYRIFSSDPQNAPVGEAETITDLYRIAVPVGTGLGIDQRITTSDGTVWQVIKLVTLRTDAVDEQAYIAREHRT